MLKNKKKEIFIWCSEISRHSGEGLLALNFIEDIKKIQDINILVKTPGYKIFKFKQQEIINNRFKENSKFSKYLNIFTGILYCWFFFLRKKKVCYLNYLPLWNFIIFFLLPPKTILGPITGGSAISNTVNISYLIRVFLFPVFYKISLSFIYMRTSQILFSTNLLNKCAIKKDKQYHFNFVFRQIKDKKIKKKTIDLLIYNREYENKYTDLMSIIKTFLALKKSVHVVGNKIMFKGVVNHGYIKNEEVQYLLKKTKYTTNSSENFYSLFIIQAISNKVKIIVSSFDKKRIVSYNPKVFLSHTNYKKKINLHYKNNIIDFKNFYKILNKQTISNKKIKTYLLSFF